MEAFEVERDVGEADFCLGALYTDGADKQAHALLLVGEDVLDSGADLRAGSIGTLTLRRERLARCPAEVDF